MLGRTEILAMLLVHGTLKCKTLKGRGWNASAQVETRYDVTSILKEGLV